MILADKITEERKKNGWSQEDMAQRLGVSRQSVSKWESAGSIPDLQKVIQLANLFGVSTDYLLKDEMGSEDRDTGSVCSDDTDAPLRRVSMEEANEFLSVRTKAAPLIANATSLCIISPVPLILLAASTRIQSFPITDGMAAGLGCAILFVAVAVAVYLAWTFSTRQWDFTWIVWPVAGVLFAAVYGIARMVVKDGEN